LLKNQVITVERPNFVEVASQY